jgi:aspartate-semialdehyde dehydrogenase
MLQMDKLKVGVIGATGMVGQRFITLISEHPWFQLSVLAASARTAGQTYEEAIGNRWKLDIPMPDCARKMIVRNASDVQNVVKDVDFVFCAVDMQKDEILALEEEYAKAECPVVSNNSANRWTPDVPMVIPEINPEHLAVLEYQKKRLGTKRGFIAVKSNCSIQSYVPALSPFRADCGVSKVLACTYQAISGAGKTFDTWPEMVDNVIPYIGGEEEKSEQEPMKVWGHVDGGVIVNAEKPVITAQCLRVASSNGHMAAVFASFDRKPSFDEMIRRWAEYKGRPQELGLPSAPKQFIRYFEEPDRPQTRLDRMNEGGMQIGVGRLRSDAIFDCRFVCLSHNTLRGAAGGGVELAELLVAEGYIKAK